jgi:hypothetical protein
MIREYLIRRAKRTPYSHLDGYMRRFWLVPYRRELIRIEEFYFDENYQPTTKDEAYDISFFFRDDGTGPVSWKRPIAKLLQLCGIAVRVHRILRSDHGRDPHDHPWPYLTIVLFGGYWEERYDDEGMCISQRWHGPGSILYRPAGSWHRLDLPPGKDCWTLFITGPYRQGWGFNVRGKKIPHKNYLAGGGNN